MSSKNYFPDSNGKFSMKRNDEPCFFITVFRLPFHGHVYSKYRHTQSHCDDVKTRRPNPVPVRLHRVTRSAVNPTCVKATPSLYPKPAHLSSFKHVILLLQILYRTPANTSPRVSVCAFILGVTRSSTDDDAKLITSPLTT